MPKHWQPKLTKSELADDINRILEGRDTHFKELVSLVNMSRKDLGNLHYYLLEIFEPVRGQSDDGSG